VQAGDGYSIYAQLPADKPMKVSVDGKPAEIIDLRRTERPLVERGVAQAKISSMLEREVTSKVDLKKSIVSLAVEQRIMTPYTAMLVLETEQDYARFHIERKSLIDVLAIQDHAVKRVHRTTFALPVAVAPPAEERDEEEPTAQKAMSEAPEAKAEARKDASGPAPRSQRPGAVGGAYPRPAASAAPRPSRTVATTSPASPAPRPRMVARPSSPSADAPAPAAAPPPAATRGPRASSSDPMASSALRELDDPSDEPSAQGDDFLRERSKAPYEGKFAQVMEALTFPLRRDEALAMARAWQKESPGDVLALVALGEAAEAKGVIELAARAYGSVVDLFPNRADLRRFAGERLERLKDASAASLAIDTFRKAVADRPDHPSSHRLLAFALLRDKQYEKAFEAALIGARRGYDVERFEGVDRILREDLGLVGAAWARAEPGRREQILGRVRQAGGRIEDQPSLRFVLDWQTDANDVDFHIHDSKGGHAYFSQPHLRSGGDLYGDVTTGYGPECFTIRLPKAKRSSYKLEAHYYSRGPMGYGMGKLEIVDHDGKGNITFEERPFIVMADSAFVDLGTVK